MQYFKKHDTDNNMKLDGLEMLKALANMEDHDHAHDDGEEGSSNDKNNPEDKQSVDELIPLVDSILEEDDKDKDGYINWPEFMSQQNRQS